jgi:hypothetical protein
MSEGINVRVALTPYAYVLASKRTHHLPPDAPVLHRFAKDSVVRSDRIRPLRPATVHSEVDAPISGVVYPKSGVESNAAPVLLIGAFTIRMRVLPGSLVGRTLAHTALGGLSGN